MILFMKKTLILSLIFVIAMGFGACLGQGGANGYNPYAPSEETSELEIIELPDAPETTTNYATPVANAGVIPVNHSVTVYEGRNPDELWVFSECFFDKYYVLKFSFAQPTRVLEYEVANVLSNGDIIMQKRTTPGPEAEADSPTNVSFWTFVVVLHRSFFPPVWWEGGVMAVNVIFPSNDEGEMPWYTNDISRSWITIPTDVPLRLRWEEPTPDPIFPGSNIHGALHRVEYGENVAYLFGTLHAGQAHWFPLSELVEDAMRRADVVAVERADLAETWEVRYELIQDVLYLPDGQTWSEFLPEEYYRHLVNMMIEWDVNYEDVNTRRPPPFIRLLIDLLDNQISATDLSGIETSVDGHVISVARESGVPIIGLESIEQAMLPPEDVMLAQIRNFVSPTEFLEARANKGLLFLDDAAYAYERNDFAVLNSDIALQASHSPDCPSTRHFVDIVARWRTTNFANEIARLLRETEEPTTFFVAVGIYHIISSGAGEPFTDIVEQLGLMGFSVVPLWE